MAEVRHHQMTIRHWERPDTYQARCTCGWVASWPHSSKEKARQDGLHHLVCNPRRIIVYGWDEYWLPGV